MSTFADDDTRVVVQGITGGEGKSHARQVVRYGTSVVAGTSPGKGGRNINGIPVYDTVEEAVDEEDANASVVFVPPAFAGDAIFEALNTDFGPVVVITEGVPTQDMAKVNRRLSETDTRLIDPNCLGIITPGEVKLGILPGNIFEEGNVGLVSRSGALTYQVVSSLTERGIGQATAVGIDDDPIIGTSFIGALEAFEDDPDTHAVVMRGEIGGEDEEQAARHIVENMDTSVAGFITGCTAPPGKCMGHAGAIVSGSGTGTAESKIFAPNDASVPVGDTPNEVADHIGDFL